MIWEHTEVGGVPCYTTLATFHQYYLFTGNKTAYCGALEVDLDVANWSYTACWVGNLRSEFPEDTRHFVLTGLFPLLQPMSQLLPHLRLLSFIQSEVIKSQQILSKHLNVWPPHTLRRGKSLLYFPSRKKNTQICL